MGSIDTIVKEIIERGKSLRSFYIIVPYVEITRRKRKEHIAYECVRAHGINEAIDKAINNVWNACRSAKLRGDILSCQIDDSSVREATQEELKYF